MALAAGMEAAIGSWASQSHPWQDVVSADAGNRDGGWVEEPPTAEELAAAHERRRRFARYAGPCLHCGVCCTCTNNCYCGSSFIHKV